MDDARRVKYNAYMRTWRAANLERVREQQRRQYAAEPERFREYTRVYRAKRTPEQWQAHLAANAREREKLRREAIDGYGGRCACCGLERQEFLCIDHLLDWHALELPRGGHELYRALKKQGYPDGFQVLCYNCNFSKSTYGICPHQRDKAR